MGIVLSLEIHSDILIHLPTSMFTFELYNMKGPFKKKKEYIMIMVLPSTMLSNLLLICPNCTHHFQRGLQHESCEHSSSGSAQKLIHLSLFVVVDFFKTMQADLALKQMSALKGSPPAPFQWWLSPIDGLVNS